MGLALRFRPPYFGLTFSPSIGYSAAVEKWGKWFGEVFWAYIRTQSGLLTIDECALADRQGELFVSQLRSGHPIHVERGSEKPQALISHAARS